MGKIITIQPSNTPSGKYDVHMAVPYPFHVGEDGMVGRQEFWRGDPKAVLGFQRDIDLMMVDLFWADAVADPEQMVGMFPVFTTSDGRWYTLRLPISGYSITDESEASS